MNSFKKWQNELKAKWVVETLNAKGYEAHYFDEIGQVKAAVIDMVELNATVALE